MHAVVWRSELTLTKLVFVNVLLDLRTETFLAFRG